MIKFSVVMSVYGGDVPEHFRDSICSVLEQSLAPSEIIIVVDGPVNDKLETVLSEVAAVDPVKVLRTPCNNGLGFSRRLAISEAKCPFIAVMDADDICVTNRFERQLPILESCLADVVGSWIEEFDNKPGDLNRVRRVPITHEQIFKYGKWRQPLNHVTIMFSKEAYLKAGGYQPTRCVEDYDLFVRMLKKGARFYNIPDVLVYVRCGDSMLKRRSGITYLASELRLFHKMYIAGYLNLFQLFANVLIRIVSRPMPDQLLRIIYDKWLRYNTQRLTRK